MTEGEERVGLDFNPSGNEDVVVAKSSIADLIDMLNEHSDESPTKNRVIATAKTKLEDACMWVVKAIIL